MTGPDSKPARAFRSAAAFEQWLAKHQTASDGIWLRLYKKGSGKASIAYSEAVDVALCYGWIDGQGKSLDDLSYIQKFTPRRPRSVWSKLNRERISRLMKAGRMQPAGRAQVNAAKKDGRWAAAYHPPSRITMPPEFMQALAANKGAQAFFGTLNKRNTYAIAHRLQSAKKPETRERRINAIVDMLANGEKFYP